MKAGVKHLLEKGEVVNETYVVQCFIGEGAFGEVYRVKHKHLGLQALKVFKDDYVNCTDLKIVTAEAEILAKLVHKNIVRVFDANSFSRDGKQYHFMTVGFVSGESLANLLGREISLPLPVSLSIQQAILQGLNELHSQSPPIIHRDISPDNILLSYDGDCPRALIADFGLAQSFDQMSAIADAAGKYLYMAPECFWRAYLPASDVFSAGVVLYRMVTGDFPWDYDFDAIRGQDPDSMSTMITKARNAMPHPPSAYNSLCSKSLDRIVLKAIDRDIEKRYLTAEAFLVELSKEFREAMDGGTDGLSPEGLFS
jgi:serine/threonine-protein kinase